MNISRPFVELKTSSGNSIECGDMTLRPEAQALVVRLPFMGFVWNRPVAFVLEADGRRERFPINDTTRTAVLMMSGMGMLVTVAFVLASFLAGSRRSEENGYRSLS